MLHCALVQILAHAAAADDNPGPPQQGSKQTRPDAVGFLADKNVQRVGCCHADNQRQDGNGIDVHSVRCKVACAGQGMPFGNNQDEHQPQEEQSTHGHQHAQENGLEVALGVVLCLVQADALHGQTAGQEVRNLEQEVHYNAQCTVDIDGRDHKGCNVHPLFRIGTHQAEAQIATTHNGQAEQEGLHNIAKMEAAIASGCEAIAGQTAAPPFGVSKMVDQEEYQQGNSIGEIQLAELKQKQSA